MRTPRALAAALQGRTRSAAHACGGCSWTQTRAQSASADPNKFFKVDPDRYKHNLGPNARDSERSMYDDGNMVGMSDDVEWQVGGRQIKLFYDDSSEQKLAKYKKNLPGMLPCDQPGSEAAEHANAAEEEMKQVDALKKRQQQLLSSMAAADRNTPITDHAILPADMPPHEREQHEQIVKEMERRGGGRGGTMNAGPTSIRGMMQAGAMAAAVGAGRGRGRGGGGNGDDPNVNAAAVPSAGGRGTGALGMPARGGATRAVPTKMALNAGATKKSSSNTGTAATNKDSGTSGPATVDDLKAELKSQAAKDKAQASQDAASFFEGVPKHVDKNELWQRIHRNVEMEKKLNAEGVKTADPSDPDAAAAHRARNSQDSSALSRDPSYVDFIKNEEEIKVKSPFHFAIGQQAFERDADRQDYYACHILCMSLNKARWNQMDVLATRGMGTTGVGMRTMFWKESLHKIINSGEMISGQFVDGHPVLRPFAAVVKRKKLTKAFMRGFVDARLKIVPQPGNMEQLSAHVDKTHGYFYNTMLEVVGRKDDNLEHIMKHVGRAVGIIQAIMLWRKYAQLGHTLLPADVCARHHVNMALLTNTALANRDPCVRNVIHDCAQVAFDEMRHACQIARDADPVAWPVLVESVFPNYYLQFLQNYDNDVSRFFADAELENYGFQWYLQKKMWHWRRHHDVAELLNSAAPVPFLGVSWGYGGIKYQEAEAEAAKQSAEKEWLNQAVAQGGIGGMKLEEGKNSRVSLKANSGGPAAASTGCGSKSCSH